ncbi:hypothetical protein BV20DRAFT_1056129 [Pilatotrama ljubarskyi]|nr:hypothetical protein BV20DRAFT_1056129 [Pilatotrama ljubarskyi]
MSSALTSVGPRLMLLNLDTIALNARYCATDLQQGLLLIAGFVPSDTSVLQCHILSLPALPTTCYDERAAAPVLSVSTDVTVGHAQTLTLNVCGDLLGWAWLDHTSELRIFNWKTGGLVWRFAGDTFSFAFLDHTSIVVAHRHAHVLQVFALDSSDPAPNATSGLVDQRTQVNPVLSFSLPQLIEGTYQYIEGLRSQIPSPVTDHGTLFQADPHLSVLVVCFTTIRAGNPPDSVEYVEQYVLFTPLAALLAYVRREGTKIPLEGTDHDYGSPRTIPWETWSTLSTRILRAYGPLTTEHMSVLGSQCAIAFYRRSLPLVLDVFIFDLHPFVDNTGDDRDALSGLIHTEPVMHNAKTLRCPVRNDLPYRVWHKKVEYDNGVDFEGWGTSFVTLMDDGLVVAKCSKPDMSMTILNTFSV